jgi:hypothetical protein
MPEVGRRVPAGVSVGEFFVLSPPGCHDFVGVMLLIKLHNKIRVQTFIWVPELVIILDLYWEENPGDLTIIIINYTLLCISVINEPFQKFNARENRSPARHHV